MKTAIAAFLALTVLGLAAGCSSSSPKNQESVTALLTAARTVDGVQGADLRLKITPEGKALAVGTIRLTTTDPAKSREVLKNVYVAMVPVLKNSPEAQELQLSFDTMDGNLQPGPRPGTRRGRLPLGRAGDRGPRPMTHLAATERTVT